MLDWSAWNKTNSLTQVGRLALYWYCETDMKWNIFMMYENWVWALIDCAVNRNQILYIHKTKCWDDNDKLLFAHYYLLYCLCWSIWWLWNLCGKRTQSERHGTWKKYKLMYEMIHVMQCPVCYIITYMKITSTSFSDELMKNFRNYHLEYFVKFIYIIGTQCFKTVVALQGGRMFHLSRLVYHV